MPARRIIPCLDVKDGRVVKGVKFRDHEIVGEIAELCERYVQGGADEIVFYDIAASAEGRRLTGPEIRAIARNIDVPFCVAGGLRSVADAIECLENGADKISINSPALEDPSLIEGIAKIAGVQCVVVGIDSFEEDNDWFVYQYTGDPLKSRRAGRRTLDWIAEAQERGAGEIVLNCMNSDGVRSGYDIRQLRAARRIANVPLIASGGAGAREHFLDVFEQANVSGALAASVFHRGLLSIPDLKDWLHECGIEVRR